MEISGFTSKVLMGWVGEVMAITILFSGQMSRHPHFETRISLEGLKDFMWALRAVASSRPFSSQHLVQTRQRAFDQGGVNGRGLNLGSFRDIGDIVAYEEGLSRGLDIRLLANSMLL